MTRIISLEGGPAVGKTTLARNLKKRLPKIHFNFEDSTLAVSKARQQNLDKTIEQDFIENQKIFIKETIEKCQQLPDTYVVMDLSPEETEFHTICWPKAIGKSWNMEKNLAKELTQLKKFRSLTILYLDCPENVLRSRKKDDNTRQRSSFEQYLSSLHQFRKKWFNQLDYVTMKNVTNMSEEELAAWTVNWLENLYFMEKGII
ncbi:AAA family ATPase [Patescibacteria group bacterium]|nr:AAA family ATPase [Patescibacteria group bacterium]